METSPHLRTPGSTLAGTDRQDSRAVTDRASRPIRPSPAPVAAAVVAAAVAMAAGGCGSSGHRPPATTAPATTAPAPTTVPATITVPVATTLPAPTTTAYAPSAAAASAEGAADALLGAWDRGDRAAAAAVGAPGAVQALFAAPGRPLQFRGCSDGTPPLTCTYADRSSAAGTLYQLDAAPAAGGGWYVSAVQIEQ